jgi:hypothetical protein
MAESSTDSVAEWIFPSSQNLSVDYVICYSADSAAETSIDSVAESVFSPGPKNLSADYVI